MATAVKQERQCIVHCGWTDFCEQALVSSDPSFLFLAVWQQLFVHTVLWLELGQPFQLPTVYLLPLELPIMHPLPPLLLPLMACLRMCMVPQHIILAE